MNKIYNINRIRLIIETVVSVYEQLVEFYSVTKGGFCLDGFFVVSLCLIKI